MAHVAYDGFPAFGRNDGATLSMREYPPSLEGEGSIRRKIHELNCLLVFNVIRRFGPVTQARIIEETGLSNGAVSQFVAGLIKAGVVYQAPDADLPHEETATLGRKRIPLLVMGSAGYVIAIDIGQTHLRIVITDILGEVMSSSGDNQGGKDPWDQCYTRNFKLSDGPDKVLPIIANKVRERLRALHIPLDSRHILGITIGIPGHVDSAYDAVNIPDAGWKWAHVNVAERLAQELHIAIASATSSDKGIGIYVENNANLGAIAVWRNSHLSASGSTRRDDVISAGADVSRSGNIIYVKVGANIEAGLILNGTLYRGSEGTAGEMGHVQVMEEVGMRDCLCGRMHCLDTIAGSVAVIAVSGIASRGRSPREVIEDVVEEAKRGEMRSRTAIETAGQAVGRVLVNLINMLNPAEIVLDGAIVHTDGLFSDAVRRAVDAGLSRNSPPIRELEKGAHAVITGGISLAIESGWETFIVNQVKRVFPD